MLLRWCSRSSFPFPRMKRNLNCYLRRINCSNQIFNSFQFNQTKWNSCSTGNTVNSSGLSDWSDMLVWCWQMVDVSDFHFASIFFSSTVVFGHVFRYNINTSSPFCVKVLQIIWNIKNLHFISISLKYETLTKESKTNYLVFILPK